MKETKTTNPAVEQNNDTKPAENQNVDNQTADTGNDTPDSVPYARFNEITRQNKKLQEQIKKDEEARESARIKQMEEEGKTKELYAELQIESKSLKEKVAHYEEIEKQERDSLLEQLSEEDRELYGNLSTPSLKKHLSKMSINTTVPTDKSTPIRKSGLNIKDTEEIWDMKGNVKRDNWDKIVNFYNNKKK